jgi:hypothetical protein
MSEHMALVLATVNAPYSEQLDSVALAHCLSDIDLAKQYPGQVSSFFQEVPVAQQMEFAAAHHIGADALKAFALLFSAWSGETYQIAA